MVTRERPRFFQEQIVYVFSVGPLSSVPTKEGVSGLIVNDDEDTHIPSLTLGSTGKKLFLEKLCLQKEN